jgi:hypothetical protein
MPALLVSEGKFNRLKDEEIHPCARMTPTQRGQTLLAKLYQA